MGLNESVFEYIFGLSHQNPFLDILGIFLATYLPYGLIIGFFALLFLFSRDWRSRLAFFGEAILVLILSRGFFTEAIRFFYPNPRPGVSLGISPLISELSSSFPSGHAAVFFSLAMVIFYFNRRWGICYFFLALINGLSRIFVGVHWPLDIIGGMAVGILSGIIVHSLVYPYVKKVNERVVA